MKRVVQSTGRLAAMGVAAIALTLFVGEGGCEFEVGDVLPDFSCVPASGNAPDPCPSGFACAIGSHKCMATAELPCQPSCANGTQCDHDTGRCMRLGAVDAGHGDVTVHSETGADGRNDTTGDVGGDTLPGEAGDVVTPPEEPPPTCRGLMCNCAGASACDSAVCIGQDPITTPVFMAANSANFCTKPCCTSADCSASTVCFAPGTGGNYCVKPAWIGRVAPLGAAIGGAMCKVDSDCRSGLCTPGGTCADTCCSTADQSMSDAAAVRAQCAAGAICRFSTFPGNVSDTHYTAWCSPPGNGMGPGGSACGLDGVCASNRCGIGLVCESACRSSVSCGSNMACAYTPGPFMNKDIAAGCVRAMGPGAVGATCANNNDCVTNFCDTSTMPSMGHCSDVCFADSDCTKLDWHCRPANVTLSSGLTYHILSCGI